jgi:DNA polymerase III epsilon subunit-like protein
MSYNWSASEWQRDYLVIDVETTGLNVDADDVVEWACVRFDRGEPVEHVSVFVRPFPALPDSEVFARVSGCWYAKTEAAKRLNVIPRIMSAEPFVNSYPLLLAILGRSPVWAGHCADFDLAMLHAVTERAGHHMPFPRLLIDTAVADHFCEYKSRLAPLPVPDRPSHKLLDAMRRRRLEEPSMSHTALADAMSAGLLLRQLIVTETMPLGLEPMARWLREGGGVREREIQEAKDRRLWIETTQTEIPIVGADTKDLN